jgi:HlyD family secretion protein
MTDAQKKWMGWAAVSLLVLAVLLASLASREPAPEVASAVVERARLQATIVSNGKVEPIVPHTIRAQVATFVRSVSAVEGQTVRAGDALLRLDDEEAAAEVARLRRELVAAQELLRAGRSGGNPVEVAQLEGDARKAEADAARLRKEFEAIERLLAKQAATQAERDLAKLTLDRAENDLRVLRQRRDEVTRQAKLDVERGSLEMERVRAALAAAEEHLRSARVTAPVNGTLYALPVRTGQYVRVGDLLAEVGDLARVQVRAFVDEPELGSLSKDQPVEISWDAQPGQTWRGRTETIPKAVVARGTRSVGEVLCSVENEKLQLLPNTNVNVVIRVRERADALVAPRAAVRTEGSQRFVFVLDGTTVRRRDVQVGIASATQYEVLSGLHEGERVAIPGDAMLRDGITVRLADPR